MGSRPEVADRHSEGTALASWGVLLGSILLKIMKRVPNHENLKNFLKCPDFHFLLKLCKNCLLGAHSSVPLKRARAPQCLQSLLWLLLPLCCQPDLRALEFAAPAGSQAAGGDEHLQDVGADKGHLPTLTVCRQAAYPL